MEVLTGYLSVPSFPLPSPAPVKRTHSATLSPYNHRDCAHGVRRICQGNCLQALTKYTHSTLPRARGDNVASSRVAGRTLSLFSWGARPLRATPRPGFPRAPYPATAACKHAGLQAGVPRLEEPSPASPPPAAELSVTRTV